MLIEELSQSVTLFGLGMGTVFVLLAMLIACVTTLSVFCRYVTADHCHEKVDAPFNDEDRFVSLSAGGTVQAPLSANVIEVCVEAGTFVGEGDVVMRLEAMKMETEVRANCSGMVSEIHANPGENVDSGQAIVTLSSAGGARQQIGFSQQSMTGDSSNAKREGAENNVQHRTINAPLSANVVDVCIELHHPVKEGDVVVKLEAMKMETEVLADCDGDVSAIHIKKGDSISAGQIILTLN